MNDDAIRIAAIEQTWPIWSVDAIPSIDGMHATWTAVRHTQLSEAEKAAGLVRSVQADSPSALISVLSRQDMIQHSSRVR